MRLTLLRSPIAPNPDADRELHNFTYSLLPHFGDFREGGVIPAGYFLNQPLLASFGESSAESALCEKFSLLSVDQAGVVVETIKPAEDGNGFIARIYEAFGGSVRARAILGVPAEAVFECDLLERELGEVSAGADQMGFEFEMTPYKIRTFRVMARKGGKIECGALC
jgi:alpha-mannosidase